MSDWKETLGVIINEFLSFLNCKSSNFILKGGTALMLCYGLDRFSEDIDLDGKICKGSSIFDITESFCKERGYTYRIAKNTDTVNRIMLNYDNYGKPLKIEVSLRRKDIPENETTIINGILAYRLEPLCIMKAGALSSRDRVRDLYDTAFICLNHYDSLSPQAQFIIRNAVEHKGFEYYDYVIRQDNDELIDNEKLSNNFLDMYDKLGLIYDRNQNNNSKTCPQRKLGEKLDK